MIASASHPVAPIRHPTAVQRHPAHPSYDAVACFNPENRNQRKPLWDGKKNPEGRWRVFTYEELVARDKCSLDVFWLKDESLEDSARLPEPHILAGEIAEDLRSALEQIESVLGDLQARVSRT